MRKWASLLLLIGLVACKKPEAPSADEAPKTNALKPAAAANAAAATPGATAVSVPLLAYAYAYRLSLPGGQIQAALDRDQQACAAAGPQTCQLVGSNLSRQGQTISAAHLELRAVPAWIAHFRAGIEGQTQSAGGHVAAATVESEDLSRSIVDTEASIRAQTTLRDRIQRLLAERPGKLSDVMEAEQQLAKVQGELDATQSELAVMRTRVDTSKLTIDYEALGVAAPDGVLRPVQEAGAGFVRNMMMVFAGIVTLGSFILPFVLVIAPLVWLGLFLQARRKKAAKAPPRDLAA